MTTPITNADLAALDQRRQKARRSAAKANQKLGITPVMSASENPSSQSQAVLVRLMDELVEMGLFPRRRAEAEALVLLRMEQYQVAKGDEDVRARWPALFVPVVAKPRKAPAKTKGPYKRRAA